MPKKKKKSSNHESKNEIAAILAELKDFTPKQALFFINFGIMGNQTKAALKTYYPKFDLKKKYIDYTRKEKNTYHIASSLGAKNIQKHPNPYLLYMQMNGMDFAKAIKILDEGMSATKKEPRVVDRDDKGKPIYDYVEEPDYVARMGWWDRFMRLQNRDVSDASVRSGSAVGAKYTNPEGGTFEVVIKDYGKGAE